ncbi:hypothetical protein BS50DRAFT_78087 [Corynespora cassiicola Philippines]|uniref:Uncharacterized protein n=1 Tax=Corynespora cassiicola Philippines TaxID=1448308 RepID=A0A2T2NHT3_CORCC|nr:hypothetical protein BS50DRAFT_78087 [Corynespora cassiicola Philippines]
MQLVRKRSNQEQLAFLFFPSSLVGSRMYCYKPQTLSRLDHCPVKALYARSIHIDRLFLRHLPLRPPTHSIRTHPHNLRPHMAGFLRAGRTQTFIHRYMHACVCVCVCTLQTALPHRSLTTASWPRSSLSACLPTRCTCNAMHANEHGRTTGSAWRVVNGDSSVASERAAGRGG